MDSKNLLWTLLLAHVLTDFFLQSRKWVVNKNEKKIRSHFLYWHALCAGALSYGAFSVFGIFNSWVVPIVITLSHFLIDLVKTYYRKQNTVTFVLNQILHVIVIVLCWLAYTKQVCAFENVILQLFQQESFVLMITSYLLIIKPVSIFIGSIFKRWKPNIQQQENNEGLEKAGEWIGYLERFLILTFIFTSYFSGIGFLFAAKSIFRFGTLTNHKERALTEYILIGSLFSFTIAIAIGLFAKYLMN